MSSSLLQGVLRSHTIDQLDKSLNILNFNQPTLHLNTDDSDDELINVISLPGTPARSRPQSPKIASSRPLPGPLLLGVRKPSTDPLKALPTEISQRIFRSLSAYELARCSLVSKKWSKSQTINYVWFQRYRRENFHDESLPPGKWSKRESKQNWRIMYMVSNRSSGTTPSRSSGYSSPNISGYQTPREIKEEKWRSDADVASRPNKVEMRGMYKELGGRKARGKTKLGSAGGVRDKGGWEGDGEGEGGW